LNGTSGPQADEDYVPPKEEEYVPGEGERVDDTEGLEGTIPEQEALADSGSAEAGTGETRKVAGYHQEKGAQVASQVT
jgi:hypothetical protein